jgi:hypothetical protein
MTQGLRTLLTGTIDYAGLFPPAKLSLQEALLNYQRDRHHPAGQHVLSRFVIPAFRLGELSPEWAACPFIYAALGRGGDGLGEFTAGLAADLEAVDGFRRRPGTQGRVDVFEVRLPASLLGEGLASSACLGTPLAYAAADLRAAGLTPFFEAPPAEARRLAPLLREAGAGFKLRCGGLEASAFPPPEAVAAVIAACREAGVPLKFTAGLHHPVRRPDAGLGVTMHGFVNVFAACVLAHARGVGEEVIRTILEDEDPTHFVFTNAGFRWKAFSATVEETLAARRAFATSFGSCSFDEPHDDLRALGWL